jgi:hypothetical protein
LEAPWEEHPVWQCEERQLQAVRIAATRSVMKAGLEHERGALLDRQAPVPERPAESVAAECATAAVAGADRRRYRAVGRRDRRPVPARQRQDRTMETVTDWPPVAVRQAKVD